MVRGCSALPIMMEERQAREASMARTLQSRGAQCGTAISEQAALDVPMVGALSVGRTGSSWAGIASPPTLQVLPTATEPAPPQSLHRTTGTTTTHQPAQPRSHREGRTTAPGALRAAEAEPAPTASTGAAPLSSRDTSSATSAGPKVMFLLQGGAGRQVGEGVCTQPASRCPHARFGPERRIFALRPHPHT